MTVSSASPSRPAGGSGAFDLLHPAVQQWIWQQRWTELRDAQERAAPPILAGNADVIIAAATASGKTEAAFLPICSTITSAGPPAGAAAPPGVQAVYVSPLKALINDQYGRLDALCEHLGIPVHRWHGDVARSGKAKVLTEPSGILLITPESLEALFVLHGHAIGRIFAGLRYAVIDEMHTFIGTERGAQLRSLLHRLDLAVRRRIPRIGLSATLGDMAKAAEWLRPGGGGRVAVIVARDGAADVRLQLRGYAATAPGTAPPTTGGPAAQPGGDLNVGDEFAIADHLYRTLRGSDNLVFANSRNAVERYTDILTRRSERDRVPNEFLPHHGSLSKEIREHVESRLKDRSLPVTAICTSTLEMGIDIGSAESVAQIGPPPSVSALRQRLGRCGRRGQPQIMRLYLNAPRMSGTLPLSEQLRAEVVQATAMVDLLLERWYEPPEVGNPHLSTLIQQLLSLIAQHGGISPQDAYTTLCGGGPFGSVSPAMFAALLRCLGDRDVVMQAGDGLLLLGGFGERAVNHYTFYAAFRAAEEYRLIAGGQELGTLAPDKPISVGSLIVFAGRRWKIVDIDHPGMTIELTPSSGGRPPRFGGKSAAVSDVVRARMLALYRGDHHPAYLDATARHLLDEGRRTFALRRLADNPLVAAGGQTHVVAWRGDRVLSTLAVALTAHGLPASPEEMTLVVQADARTTAAAIRELAAAPAPAAVELAGHVGNKAVEKWDDLLDEPLLNACCAARDLDVAGAWEELARLRGLLPPERSAGAGPPPGTRSAAPPLSS